MITHVAIWYKDKLYSLPKPKRHHDIIRLIAAETGGDVGFNESGFLDDKGRFLRRKPALIEAQKCGQLLPRATHPGGQLYSEDVW